MTSIVNCCPCPTRMRRLSILAAVLIVSTALPFSASWAEGPITELKPMFWNQRLLFIPYRANPQNLHAAKISKVQLLESRIGSGDWRVLQDALANVQGFSFHAPEDGEFWFALKHLDRHGRPIANGAEVAPQIRIVVDTIKPEFELHGTLDRTGAISVRYEARDANLDPDSLLIELRVPGGTWSPAAVGPADVVHRDRLVGRALWQSPNRNGPFEVRASIVDRAGNRAESSAQVATTVPPAKIPETIVDASSTVVDPFQQVPPRETHNWPISNQLAPRKRRRGKLSVGPPIENQGAPPANNPYSASGSVPLQEQPSTKLAANGRWPGIASIPTSLPALPLQSEPPVDHLTAPRAESGTSWAQAGKATSTARVVNSRTFEIEYDLQSVGPWGVSKVELWGTQDGGQTWQSFGQDDDFRSPMRVTVPSAGTFGLRILVDGADGVAAPPPRSGDRPELIVTIDLQSPKIESLSAEPCQINLADHVQVRWSVVDTNLDARPIGLSYSSSPSGPWSTIAAAMENTGHYAWRIERHIPGRFYLRLEARDVAGNVSTYQAPSPIELPRSHPTGRLRGVRPIGPVAD